MRIDEIIMLVGICFLICGVIPLMYIMFLILDIQSFIAIWMISIGITLVIFSIDYMRKNNNSRK